VTELALDERGLCNNKCDAQPAVVRRQGPVGYVAGNVDRFMGLAMASSIAGIG